MHIYYFVLMSVCLAIDETNGSSTKESDHKENLKLAYSIWEPAEEKDKNFPPIIFLHGLTADRFIWGPFAPRIAEETGRKVYAPDARNHGDSPWTDNFTFDAMADDLNDFMESHDIPKALLVGHSMGGRVALTFALKYPEKVEKFVSEDMSTANSKPEDLNQLMSFVSMLQEVIKKVPSGLDERQAKMFLAQFLRSVGQPNEKSEIMELELLNIVIKKEDNHYVWKANLAAIKKAFKDNSLHQDLRGQYQGEALFLYGGKSDIKVDSDTKNIKALFPNAELVKVDEAGHEIHTMFPDLFIKEISRFANK